MTWGSTAQAYLAAGSAYRHDWLVTITVKPIAGGAAETFGFWTGDDHQNWTVDGTTRTYFGAQGALDIGPIRYEPGAMVGTQDIAMALSPEGVALVRGYEMALAPVTLHCAMVNLDTGGLVEMARFFTGFVDDVVLTDPIGTDPGRISLTLASRARLGTLTVGGKKSHESQKLRSGDKFSQYADLGRVAGDPWGNS